MEDRYAATRLLSLSDVADLGAYESSREQFREKIISLKRMRRMQLGDLMSVVFENRETILFQIQEMARAERMASDAQIIAELDTYNPLIPLEGELSATLFIELRSAPELKEWLPKLVGIERSIVVRVGEGHAAAGLRSEPEATHASSLTRGKVTASVHYLRWTLNAHQIAAFRTEPVAILVDHPQYSAETRLSEECRRSLLEDLVGE